MRIKLLNDEAVVPVRMNDGDAGFDLVATSVRYDVEHGFYEYGTGIAVQIPKGCVGDLRARSSISKKDMFLCNGVGTIDQGYQGEIKIRMKATRSEPRIYDVGERIAQLVVVAIQTPEIAVVDDFEAPTQRGAGGFGSSGE